MHSQICQNHGTKYAPLPREYVTNNTWPSMPPSTNVYKYISLFTESRRKSHTNTQDKEIEKPSQVYIIALTCYKGLAPLAAKSLISLFNRPLTFVHTFVVLDTGDPSSSPSPSSSELSLSATKRSTQPSGRGSILTRDCLVGTIFLLGFLGGGGMFCCEDVGRDVVGRD